MKHNTKHTVGAATTTKKRMIGLRPEADEMAEIEQLAKQQMRPIAQMALVCMRLGLRQIQTTDQQGK